MDGLREERDQRWTRREEERGIARTEQHRTRTRHSLSRRRGRGAAAQTLPSWSVLWHCRSTAPATGSLALQSHECMHGYVDSKLQRARSSDFKASNTNSNPGHFCTQDAHRNQSPFHRPMRLHAKSRVSIAVHPRLHHCLCFMLSLDDFVPSKNAELSDWKVRPQRPHIAPSCRAA